MNKFVQGASVMDRKQMTKVLNKWSHTLRKAPVSEAPTRPSKEEQRRQADEAIASGVKVTKLPPGKSKQGSRQ